MAFLFFHDSVVHSSDFIQFFTDAAPSVGFGGFFQGQWFTSHWPPAFSALDFSSAPYEKNQMHNYLESARFYMRKGLAASTLKSYDFVWITLVSFCASLNIPLKPVQTPPQYWPLKDLWELDNSVSHAYLWWWFTSSVVAQSRLHDILLPAWCPSASMAIPLHDH